MLCARSSRMSNSPERCGGETASASKQSSAPPAMRSSLWSQEIVCWSPLRRGPIQRADGEGREDISGTASFDIYGILSNPQPRHDEEIVGFRYALGSDRRCQHDHALGAANLVCANLFAVLLEHALLDVR